jgi:hypothetical protein
MVSVDGDQHAKTRDTFKYADGFQHANTRDCILCEALLLQMKMVSADEFQHANTRVCV